MLVGAGYQILILKHRHKKILYIQSAVPCFAEPYLLVRIHDDTICSTTYLQTNPTGQIVHPPISPTSLPPNTLAIPPTMWDNLNIHKPSHQPPTNPIHSGICSHVHHLVVQGVYILDMCHFSYDIVLNVLLFIWFSLWK